MEWGDNPDAEIALLCPGGLDLVISVFKDDLTNNGDILISSGYCGNIAMGNFMKGLALKYDQPAI